MHIIDTDILIDYLRLYPKALNYLDNLKAKNRYISILSQFEILNGCKNKQDQENLKKFLKNFNVIYITEEISKKALEIYEKNHLKINLSIPDSFIAATTFLKKASLLTRNIKHFKKIPSIKAISPY